jgi:hypothetical protein
MIIGISCDKVDDVIKSNKLNTLDIVNANSLFIASNNLKSSINENKLFKITKEGYIEEVKFFDSEGIEMTVENSPVAIYNVNSTYVIVLFGSDYINVYSGYLVRKSDGAVFSLEKYPMPLLNYFNNFNPVQIDENNNIYYLSTIEGYSNFSEQLIKINTNNPSSLTSLVISPSSEHVETYNIDKLGNVIYYGRQLDEISGSSSIYRILKTNGGLYNLASGTDSFWRALDGNLYFIGENNNIKKIVIDDNNNVIIEDYGSIPDFYYNPYDSYILTLMDKVYIIDQNAIFEVFNSTNTPKQVDKVNLSTIKNAVASDNYYYISGNDQSNNSTLYKIDAESNTFMNILTPGDYDIYSMTVSSDDILTFSALRMMDGKKIIGEIGSNCVFTILDEELNAEIKILERIN